MPQPAALGIRWSRIDWEQKTVLLDTKIVAYTENHKKIALPVEESPARTLPLPLMVVEMLEEQKARREMYRKMFKCSYNRKFDDYVYINQLGELMMSSYVTSHFGNLRFHDLRHTYATIFLYFRAYILFFTLPNSFLSPPALQIFCAFCLVFWR